MMTFLVGLQSFILAGSGEVGGLSDVTLHPPVRQDNEYTADVRYRATSMWTGRTAIFMLSKQSHDISASASASV